MNLYDSCLSQEQALTMKSFSRKDAYTLGMLLNKNAQIFEDPVAIEITLNSLVVFRYFPDGALPDSELWLARKRNSVHLMDMSSLRFGEWLKSRGETLLERKLNPDQYATGGGGFPIRLTGTGVIGSICVSGLADIDDHRLIVDSLTQFLNEKA